MRAPLPAGGKIELGTGYAGALAPKASPRRQLPRASRGGGGGWGGASRQQQPTSIPRTSHHLATASAAKSKKLDKGAPGKREEKYRSWRSVAERGALPPDPRPAGGPGRGLAPQRAKLFASSRNNWRFTAERGALPPDPRPAGGPGRGLGTGTPPLQTAEEVGGALRAGGAAPRPPPRRGPWQGPGPPGGPASVRCTGQSCLSAPARTFKPRKSNDESSRKTNAQAASHLWSPSNSMRQHRHRQRLPSGQTTNFARCALRSSQQ